MVIGARMSSAAAIIVASGWTARIAIAARPGRVDQAIEVPLPDADCRRRLFHLYCDGLDVVMTDEDLDLTYFAAQCQAMSNAALVWMHGNEPCPRRKAAIRRIIAERHYNGGQIQAVALTASELNEREK